MCGIVAYSGNRSATPILLNGLRRLEYRGYDSAGIAIQSGGELEIFKQEGKVANLAGLLGDLEESPKHLNARLGIAHTRWATHGPPTTANAHPHPGGDQRIALVHNGIIENYRGLRARLESEGRVFLSDTDSEVLAQLIDTYYEDSNTDLLHAIIAALKEVEGTFGIACISKEEPDTLIVARRGSPIVIGLGDEETIVASDASAIISRHAPSNLPRRQ